MFRSREAGEPDSLDRLATGVLILDTAGWVLFSNRTAQQIAAQDDGLRLERDGLAAALPSETAALRRMIANAALTTNGNGVHAGGALLLSRPSLRRPLALSIPPLPRDEFFPGLPGTAAVAVFVTDPESAGETDGALLGRLYGLTRAETRLASALLDGNDLREAAGELGVSYHTARAQAKSIFGKTTTRSQTDLLRLLLKLPSAASGCSGVSRPLD